MASLFMCPHVITWEHMTSDSSELSGVEPPKNEPSWREFLGLPAPLAFLEGVPPRPADREQLRAFHSGALEPMLESEIQVLTQCYREWADANKSVLVELLKTDLDDISGEDSNNGSPS